MCNIVQDIRSVDLLVLTQGTKVCLTYMYMYNTHRVFGVLNMCHILVSDIITYDNDFPDPKLYVVLHADHKMSMKKTGLYHRIFLIFLCLIKSSCTWYSFSAHFCLLAYFMYLTWSYDPFLHDSLDRCFWSSCAKITSALWAVEWISICVSYLLETCSFTVIINWKVNLLSVVFRTSTTSLSFPSSLTPWPVIIL